MATKISTPPNLTAKDAIRFWDTVDIRSAERCWPWKGPISRYGYGRFRQTVGTRKRRPMGAHRVSLFLLTGEWPPETMHSCDNRRCCNPFHLAAGTRLLNAQDAARKKRTAWGTRNGNAVLTDALIGKIRQRLLRGETQRAVASSLGIVKNTVHAVAHNKTWFNIQTPGWKPLRIKTGRGEDAPRARLTPSKVRAIRKALNAGATQQSQADIYGITQESVSAICLRKSWAWLD